jgi:hypothetical protein
LAVDLRCVGIGEAYPVSTGQDLPFKRAGITVVAGQHFDGDGLGGHGGGGAKSNHQGEDYRADRPYRIGTIT